MAGKPLVVAILAGMVVAMIGVVFLQKAPEGFVVSSLLRIGSGEEEHLEEQLRKEAAAELAAEKEKAIDPNSISVVKSSQKGKEGLDVAVQAQGAKSQSAVDYVNELLVRYARRKGMVEETVSTKLEISDAERKLTAALKEKEAAMMKIEANEKEVKQLLHREQIEAQQMAKSRPQPEPSPELPEVEAPAAPIDAPQIAESRPKSIRTTPSSVPVVDDEPAASEALVLASPKPRAGERRKLVAPEPPVIEEPEVAEQASTPLSEEERLELSDALKYLKTERMKLINGGRRENHPFVQELDRQIQKINNQLQPKSKSADAGKTRQVKFEFVSSPAKESGRMSTRQRRIKLEKETASLRTKLEKAIRTESAQKARLVELVKKFETLDAAFKPVILAPAKVVTTIPAPFPYGRLTGLFCGALFASGLGYILARVAERPRTLASISEAEMVLRMPVQTIEKAVVRRRVA